MPPFIDLTDQRFSRLRVLRRGPNNRFNQPQWHCLCDCGNETLVNGALLRHRVTRSCGCYNVDLRRQICIDRNTTHGESRTVEYTAWGRMKGRCLNPSDPKYPIYGARGITVCDRWLNSFENFLTDMGRRPSSAHSLERNDVNGPYCPENCRWATAKEQQNNKTSSRFLTLGNETMTLQQWVDRTGLSHKTITGRLHRGWPEWRALTEPPDPRSRGYRSPPDRPPDED